MIGQRVLHESVYPCFHEIQHKVYSSGQKSKFITSAFMSIRALVPKVLPSDAAVLWAVRSFLPSTYQECKFCCNMLSAMEFGIIPPILASTAIIRWRKEEGSWSQHHFHCYLPTWILHH